MKDAQAEIAKEISRAIGQAVLSSPKYQRLLDEAKDSGFDVKVSLEAVLTFVNRLSAEEISKIRQAKRAEREARRRAEEVLCPADVQRLRKLRISAEGWTD